MTNWEENDFYCGQIKVMSIDIDPMRPQGSKEKYRIYYMLPGYKPKSVRGFQTFETAQNTANIMFKNWLMLMELNCF